MKSFFHSETPDEFKKSLEQVEHVVEDIMQKMVAQYKSNFPGISALTEEHEDIGVQIGTRLARIEFGSEETRANWCKEHAAVCHDPTCFIDSIEHRVCEGLAPRLMRCVYRLT